MTRTDNESATRESSRVALVTCADLPELDPDDRLAAAALARHGVRVEAAVWDDPAVDWSGFDLAVLRSTWDYPIRRDAFVAWAHRVPALANRAEVIDWNTDKRYLAELADAGLPVVPTTWLAPGAPWQPPRTGEVVIKPAIGAGSKDTGRYALEDPEHRALAEAHVRRLHAANRLVMIQPYLPAVDRDGETSLVHLGGRYSHAVRKGPMLTGPDSETTGLYKEEQISTRQPTPAQRDLAERVLAAAPDRLLYARVDLLPGPDGAPLLVELELTEPSLFLGHEPGAADRFAVAVLDRLAGGQHLQWTRRADGS